MSGARSPYGGAHEGAGAGGGPPSVDPKGADFFFFGAARLIMIFAAPLPPFLSRPNPRVARFLPLLAASDPLFRKVAAAGGDVAVKARLYLERIASELARAKGPARAGDH